MHITLLLEMKALGFSLVVFAIAPGVVLRGLLKAWPKNDPVRDELLADLAMLPFRERPFFVAAQIPNAAFDGLGTRFRVSSRTRAANRAARLSPGTTLLANSELSWVAPNGDRVPAIYDVNVDTITFETTPYVGMMPEMNVGDEAVMLLEMHYLGPSIRPMRRARLRSSLLGRKERRRQQVLRDQILSEYLSQRITG
jgi:hypothetical protein